MESQRRRGRKRRNQHFIDVAMDGYIRDIALEKWREVEDLMDAAGLSRPRAFAAAGEFADRDPYAEPWRRWWREHVKAQAPADDGVLIASIEHAVRGALTEERQARAEQGAPSMEDTQHYKAFVDRAMEHLLSEADGEIEELD